MTRQIIFRNRTDAPVQLAIEPWGMAETVQPGHDFIIDISEEPPECLEFAAYPDVAIIAVASHWLRFTTDGQVFETGSRPWWQVLNPTRIFRRQALRPYYFELCGPEPYTPEFLRAPTTTAMEQPVSSPT